MLDVRLAFLALCPMPLYPFVWKMYMRAVYVLVIYRILLWSVITMQIDKVPGQSFSTASHDGSSSNKSNHK